MQNWPMKLALGLVVFVAEACYAGEYNEVLSIGDGAPAWKDLPDVVSGKKHALEDLKDVPVVVVVFTCNSCPVATDYEERILKLAEKYRRCAKDEGRSTKDEQDGALLGGRAVAPEGIQAGKVAVVAINVNKVKEDLPPEMKERAEKMRYPFPYLFDETQKIARDFGATSRRSFLCSTAEEGCLHGGDGRQQRPGRGEAELSSKPQWRRRWPAETGDDGDARRRVPHSFRPRASEYACQDQLSASPQLQ